jgi:hypothetical protein
VGSEEIRSRLSAVAIITLLYVLVKWINFSVYLSVCLSVCPCNLLDSLCASLHLSSQHAGREVKSHPPRLQMGGGGKVCGGKTE